MAGLLERGELLARLCSARDSGGSMVLIGGEAGVGKTSLVREFAAGSGERVLQGTCDCLTTPTPLGPLVDIAAATGGEFAARIAADDDPRLVALALIEEMEPGTLVVLEDLHWADQATLDVLRVLGRRVDSTRALLVGTYRDDEVDDEHPLRLVLGDLTSAPAVSRLSVPRLSRAAVDELAAPHEADGEAIYRLTRGNAFYVTEILESGVKTLPETVRDAVLARVAVLDRQARRLLDLASLMPARAEVWLLEAIAGDSIGSLDDCLAAGILRDEGASVRFRHELARLAVEGAVGPRRRQRMHAAILASLSTPPVGSPDPSRLAHHAEEAGDSAAVLEYAPEAARRDAAAGAHRESAAQYARVLRHAGGLPAGERAPLLASFAEEAQMLGRHQESIAARREAVALYEALGDERAAGLERSLLIPSCTTIGLNEEAEEESRRSIEQLERLPPSAELALAYAGQAHLRMLAHDNDEGVAWGERAVALAREFGDRDTESFGLNMIGSSRLMAGAIDIGTTSMLTALAMAREDECEQRESLALRMLGSGLGEMFQLMQAERYLREHIAFLEERETESSYSRAWLALVHVYRGRWDEGSEEAQAVLASTSAATSRISALIALGRVRARRGDPGVLEPLDEALGYARTSGHLQRLGHVHAARAEAAWLVGDAEGAAEEARAAYPLALEKRHLWFAGELAYWQRQAGAELEPPKWIGAPYRLELEGKWRLAAASWSVRMCPYEAARTQAESDAPDALLEALSLFEGLGAQPGAQRVRDKLRERGDSVQRGPRATTRANPADLTTREVEVLRLVASGLRNAEVAEQLVVSRRTVDHHVSSILRKLPARTRVEASAAALELGLLEDR